MSKSLFSDSVQRSEFLSLEKCAKSCGHTMDTIWTQARIRVPNSTISEAGQRSSRSLKLDWKKFARVRGFQKAGASNLLKYRSNGPPERIRTSDLRLRRAALYPAELRAVFNKVGIFDRCLRSRIFSLTLASGGQRSIQLSYGRFELDDDSPISSAQSYVRSGCLSSPRRQVLTSVLG